MRKLTLDEWEKKYMVGPVEQFNQKNTMVDRIDTDPEFFKKATQFGGIFAILGKAQDRSGFTLFDQAMRWGAWAAEELDLLDTSRPNPLSASLKVKAAIEASDYCHPFMVYRPPKDIELDTSNLEELTDAVKKTAVFYGADLVGICKLDRRWVYSHTTPAPSMPKIPGLLEGKKPEGPPEFHEKPFYPQEIPEEYQYAIVTAYEMDYNLTKYYHTYLNVAAVYMGYSRMGFTNLLLSSFIRNLGYKAINCSTNEVVLSTPLATLAGLGELGRNGLLITPKFGPRVRLNVVLTDLPLVPDSPIEFGVTEFCESCLKCAEMCPSKSLSLGERTLESVSISNAPGVLKWPINSETCLLHWLRGARDCDICLAVCPYNKVYSWTHRMTKWFTDHVRWADKFYVKMDDLFGYGKLKDPNDFWKKWKPNPYGRNDYV